jgi:hypothetical protein
MKIAGFSVVYLLIIDFPGDKMGKYGHTALLAVTLLKNETTTDPCLAWEQAVQKFFPTSSSAQKKGCPRSTFLGLCHAGLIVGVKPGGYTRSKKNMTYAEKALAMLIQKPHLADDPKTLWPLVTEGHPCQHNQQLDVVISLWQNGMIKA